MSDDPLAYLRSICVPFPDAEEPVQEAPQPRKLVRIPVPIFAGLIWLDGFVVGICLMAILARAGR
jgi:hypothetical protein